MPMNEQEIGVSGLRTSPADPPSAAGSARPAGAAPGRSPVASTLDGTLVKSDTLVDSVLVMARQHPRALLSLPGWPMGQSCLQTPH